MISKGQSRATRWKTHLVSKEGQMDVGTSLLNGSPQSVQCFLPAHYFDQERLIFEDIVDGNELHSESSLRSKIGMSDPLG